MYWCSRRDPWPVRHGRRRRRGRVLSLRRPRRTRHHSAAPASTSLVRQDRRSQPRSSQVRHCRSHSSKSRLCLSTASAMYTWFYCLLRSFAIVSDSVGQSANGRRRRPGQIITTSSSSWSQPVRFVSCKRFVVIGLLDFSLSSLVIVWFLVTTGKWQIRYNAFILSKELTV